MAAGLENGLKRWETVKLKKSESEPGTKEIQRASERGRKVHFFYWCSDLSDLLSR